MLHEGAAVLARQERDVAREADAAAARVKELGNVQNWAEVLERGFLVLEETVRLAAAGSGCSSCADSGSDDDSGSGPSSDADADGRPKGAALPSTQTASTASLDPRPLGGP